MSVAIPAALYSRPTFVIAECGSVFYTSTMNDRSQRLKCPECGIQNMRALERFAVEIDNCMNCFGIWFDVGEMLKYTAGRSNLSQDSNVPDTPFNADTQTAKIICPRCATLSLQTGHAGELEMRVCRQCKGVFLPQRTHQTIFAPAKRSTKESTLRPSKNLSSTEVESMISIDGLSALANLVPLD